ncbi:protein POLLENLESS 3-like [Forsythia ovata]|uniref:Protein POLLENLESS 3-like n=1 Tax=Forsythia ovata TaxID=205694 RepID=A0ABD1R702_9LAMI
MLSPSCSDHHKNHYNSRPRGFLTPPPALRTSWCSPSLPASEKQQRRSPQAKGDLFHVIHKVPSGDSPYVKAKHVQLIDKDPSKAISLFWAAINSGDRVDSALKDMAVVMKQLDRSDEAIEAIKSFRYLCPLESQESLDNILLELYKRSGRIEEEIEMLQLKLKQLEEGIAFGGKRTKLARSQGKKIQITIEKEYSRLLGNLAWAYMQQGDFKSAEENYRKGLSFESDKNKKCNLAVCLMHMNKLTEAKFLLQTVRDSSENEHVDETHAKSFERATQMLAEMESHHVLKRMEQGKDIDRFGANRRYEFSYEYKADFDNRRKHHQFGTEQGDADSARKMDHDSPFGIGRIPKVPFTQPRSCSWSFNTEDQRKGCSVEDTEGDADSARKMAHNSPFGAGRIPKVPFTQPRRCSWSFNTGDQRRGWSVEDAKGGFCRQLSFEQSTNGENKKRVANQNLESNVPEALPQILEKHLASVDGNWIKRPLGNLSRVDSEEEWKVVDFLAYDGQKKPSMEEYNLPSELNFSGDCTNSRETFDGDYGLSSSFTNACSLEPKAAKDDSENLKLAEELQKDWKITDEFSMCENTKKSWADMVEEDEEELQIWSSSFPGKDWDLTDKEFNDENVDANIIPESPTLLNQAEDLSQKTDTLDMKSGYHTQPENTASLKNQSVKRSLCFYQHQKQGRADKALNFGGHSSIPSEDRTPTNLKKLMRRNRLQVFQDITSIPGSPRR